MDGGDSSADDYQRPTDEQASGSTDTMGAAAAYLLMKRGKRGAAAIIATECEALDNKLFENLSKQEKPHQGGSVEVSMEEEQVKNANEPSASDSSQESSDEDSYDSSDSDSDADIDAMRQLSRCRILDQLLDVLLNPLNAISNVGVSGGELDWIRWLMAGGKTLDEFTNLVKQYDYGTCCGLVWTANYVAYRCRTCSISPCMSLCADCFKAGDHAQHDFNMFRSQAGGACDCGDTSVMKADGFCRNHSHGSSSSKKYKKPPPDLLRVAERLMPRLLLRLVQYLRENSDASSDLDPNKHEGGAMAGLSGAIDHTRPLMNIGGPGAVPGLPLPTAGPGPQHQVHFQHQAHHLQQSAPINTLNKNLDDLQPFLSVLHDLSALGAAMRRLMTVSLTDERIYKWACDYYYNNNASIQGNSSHSVIFKGEEQKTQQQNLPSFSCTASSTVNTMYTTYADRVRSLYTQALRQYNIGIGGTPEPVVSENAMATGQSLAQAWPYGDASSSSSSSSSPDSSSSSSSEDDDEHDVDTSQAMEVESEQTSGVHSKKKKMKRKKKSNSSNKNKYLSHSTFLQEIVFWTVRYEFPQKIVCFLLNMLPDATYKRCLTEAFTSHYGCVARVLAATRDSDTLSNHIVHISVQLFSNESLAKRMVVRHQLLKVMVKSLRGMMNDILIPSTLHVPSRNRHKVVDCSKPVMKEHCYWPLVSDLNNVLSHRPIAVRFMRDDRLLRSWFSYLSVFQGMNVNCRELGHHVEFEPNTYYAAFSAELEASAYPMWAMLSHLSLTNAKTVSKVNANDVPHSSNADKVVKKRDKKSKHSTEDSETLKLSKRVLRACLKRLLKWLRDVHGEKDVVNWGLKSYVKDTSDCHQFTFHLPLHRYLAVFLCQAIRTAHQQQELQRKNQSQVECPRVIRNLLDELLSDVFPLKDNCSTEIGNENYPVEASATAAAAAAAQGSPTLKENDKLMDGILLKIAQHPLRAQAAFYEIMTQGAWVRNGLQIKGQAMTYVQSNFCISMVDADIYLLQLCLSEISDVPSYMRLVLDKFKADDWMKPAIVNGSQGLPAMMKGASGSPGNGSDNGNDGSPGTGGNGNEAEGGGDFNGAINDITPSALESLLVFLATLVSVRTNLCTDEDYNYCQTQLEMVTLLCVSDKTHSQLMELMPERCGGGGSTNTGTTSSTSAAGSATTTATAPPSSADRDFESVLQAVAEYKKPQFERSSGTMQQGLYVPKGSCSRCAGGEGGSDVWLKLFDPIHVLLRAVHRRDFQSSMDRYTAFVRTKGLLLNRNFQQDTSQSSAMSSSSSVCSSSSSSCSTIPWPPYRKPRRHHPAYQDPRRLLLESPAWHAVVWHALYRAARGSRDISEHTLSLLVYLLDQSVALYQERQEREKSEELSKALSQQSEHNVDSEIAMGITHEPRTKQEDEEPMETDSPQVFRYQSGEIKPEESIDKKEGTDQIGDAEDNVCPKRRIRMDGDNENITGCNANETQPLLERWYSSNDLLVNLRTVITCIDLPKRKVPSALDSSRFHENNRPSTSIGTMTSGSVNFLDYFGGALSSASNSAFRDQAQSINPQQSNSSFIPMITVPSLASLASEEIPSSTTATAPSISLSIRPAANLFNTAMSPFYSHSNTSMTVTNTTSANTTGSSSSSTSITDAALNVVKQHLQFLSNASASASVEGDISQQLTMKPDHLTFDQETCNSSNAAALAREEHKYEHIDNDESVPVDESIISLLLRLHSQLSGRPDSYQPPSSPTVNYVDSQQEYEPGDGAHYVGKLLDRIASVGSSGPSGFSLSHECVTRARNTLWPRAVVAREAATRDLEERERRERKRRAHDKQRRMMEEMARAQRAFIENARLSGELELSNAAAAAPTSSSAGEDLTGNAAAAAAAAAPRQPSSNSFSMEYEEDTPAAPTVTVTTPMVTDDISPTSNELPPDPTGQQQQQQQQDNANQSTIPPEAAAAAADENADAAKSAVENYLFNTVFETAVDCVICNQTVTVSEQQRLDPVGLVILVQGTNVLAHRRRRRKRERVAPSTFSSRVSSGKCRRICGEQGSGQAAAGAAADAATVDILQHGEDVIMVEPEEDSENYSDWPSLPPSPSKQHHNQFSLLQCAPQDAGALHDNTADGGVDNSTSTYGAYVDRKRQLLNQHFMNLDITVTDLQQAGAGRTVGGVHVQTCGHHLHLRCWRSYLASLRGAQRYASDRGEYSCPLCRQLANSVLPLTNYDFRLSVLQLRPTHSTSPMGHYMETIATLVQYLQKHQRVYKQHVKAAAVVPPQQMTSSSILSSRIMGVLSDTSVIPRVEDHPVLGSSNTGGVYNYYSLEQDPLTDAINRCVDDMITSGNSSIGNSMSAAAAAANPNAGNTSNTTWQSIVSVAWTNIQVELVQRDNSLLPPSGASNIYHQSGSRSVEGYHYYDMLPKRSCTAPLLRVLNARARRLINDPDQENVLSEIWSQLTGQDYTIMAKRDAMNVRQKQLPLMLRDPCSVLLQLVLLLPPSIERNLFDTLVKLLYNMQLYATALKVAVSSTSSLYDNYKETTGSSDSSQKVADNAAPHAGVLQNKSYFIRAVYLAKTMVLHRKSVDDDDDDENKDDDDISDANEFVVLGGGGDQCCGDMNSTNNKTLSEDDLESYARQCSLPFLRFATLLCRHMYGGNDDQLFAHLQAKEMAEDSKSRNKKSCRKRQQYSRDDYEFQMLVRHLQLVDGDGGGRTTMPTAMEACNWPVQSQNDSNIAISWFFTVRQSLRKIASTTNNDDDGPLLMMTARQLLAVDDDDNDTTTTPDAGVTAVNWTGPRLLRLPHLYDDVFQYYHGRPCHRCHGVPRETSVCLVCGTVVCLKENCCKTDNVCEAVQHSVECGGGTAMFLVVTSSSVVVIRGKRACLWGSVYLDAFGEEDRELKRGKPLYLSAERYRLLERQWLAHRFDHTNKKWVWHREQL